VNRGLLAKSLRETWRMTVAFGLGLVAVEAMLAYALPKFELQFQALLSQLTFVQDILQTLVGADVSGRFGPEAFGAIAWVHPVVLALAWGHAISFCTRLPAGEVDRGTIDVLLGLPVSRWRIYLCESAVWIVSGAAVTALLAAGNIAGGSLLTGVPRPGAGPLLIATVNMFCLYLSVGGMAWLVSAASDHRGRAVAIVFTFVVASFLLNYLGYYWRAAERLAFLGVLNYYKPLAILRDGAWPAGDMVVLLLAAGTLWLAGGLLLARRDLAAL